MFPLHRSDSGRFGSFPYSQSILVLTWAVLVIDSVHHVRTSLLASSRWARCSDREPRTRLRLHPVLTQTSFSIPYSLSWRYSDLMEGSRLLRRTQSADDMKKPDKPDKPSRLPVINRTKNKISALGAHFRRDGVAITSVESILPALKITKEASAAFPPLQSAVGAVVSVQIGRAHV